MGGCHVRELYIHYRKRQCEKKNCQGTLQETDVKLISDPFVSVLAAREKFYYSSKLEHRDDDGKIFLLQKPF